MSYLKDDLAKRFADKVLLKEDLIKLRGGDDDDDDDGGSFDIMSFLRNQAARLSQRLCEDAFSDNGDGVW